MEIDSPNSENDKETSSNMPSLKTASWNADTGITSLSKDLFSQLNDSQGKASDTGEAEADFPEYKQPKDQITTNTKLNQRIRFNLIRHRGTVSDIPSIKLFKSFAPTLKKVDPSAIFLPFHSNKQHYSSLVTLKQIENMEENKLHQFFKSYHQRQNYSISGYFHVSSVLPFNEIINKPELDEWLDAHRYFMRIRPSNAEEMVKIGMLCLRYFFVGELNSASKKTKMLFVSTEKSKQEEVSQLFKSIK